MFFGKHFSSMYGGSMIGAGAIVFAVMGYVIACQRPDKKVGSQVDINPKLLAAILGESQKDVEKAIRYLCSPDPDSTTKGDEGRRLVKIGQFAYRVVNGAKYLAIRDEDKRREQNREAQRRSREKDSLTQLPGEASAIKASEETGEITMPHELETGKNSAAFDPNSEHGTEPIGEEPESDPGL